MTSERGKGILANRHIVDDEWIPKYSQNHYDPENNTTVSSYFTAYSYLTTTIAIVPIYIYNVYIFIYNLLFAADSIVKRGCVRVLCICKMTSFMI